MAREYGRVKSKFWDSDRIKKCSPPAKMLGLYLLTSSHTNAIGCFRLPLAYMADDTGLEPKALERAFAELREAGFVQWCERMPFVWLPNYLKHNAPENPNVWRKCVKELESLPGEITAISSIADQLAEIALEPRMRKEGSQNRVSDAEITVLERYRNGIETSLEAQRPLPCPIPIPIPIPEPSSLRSEDAREARSSDKPKRKSLSPMPEDWPTLEQRDWAAGVWRKQGREDLAFAVLFQAEKCRDHHAKTDARFADWYAVWRTWVHNAPDYTSRKSDGRKQPQQQGRGIREAAEHALAALGRDAGEAQTRGAEQAPGASGRAIAGPPRSAGNTGPDHRASGDAGVDIRRQHDDGGTERALSPVLLGPRAPSGLENRPGLQTVSDGAEEPIFSDTGPIARARA